MSDILSLIDYLLDFFDEEKDFLNMINKSYELYYKHGARSSKKVDVIHEWIVEKIKKTKHFDNEKYTIKEEVNIKCANSAGKKKWDIVVSNKKTKEVILAISVKFACSNYKQNKNNYLECAIGESFLTKQKNPNIKILSFNIFIENCPYKKKDGTCKKLESISLNDIKPYKEMVGKAWDHSICYLVKHENQKIIGINKDTKYETFDSILLKLFR